MNHRKTRITFLYDEIMFAINSAYLDYFCDQLSLFRLFLRSTQLIYFAFVLN